MKILSLMLPTNFKNMDSIKKNVLATSLKKKLLKKFFIEFEICTIKAFGQIKFTKKFCAWKNLS